MTQTAVGADLLQALKVLTELAVQAVGNNLRVLAVGNIALSVQEPGRNLVLGRGLEDGDDTLELFGGEFTSAAKNFVSILAQFLMMTLASLCNVSSRAPLRASQRRIFIQGANSVSTIFLPQSIDMSFSCVSIHD